MKNNLKYSLLVILTLVSVLLSSCASNALNVVNKKRVTMTANPGQNLLKINTRGDRNCRRYSGKDENGCLVAEKYETAVFSFSLQNSSGYKFSEITICKGVSKQDLDCKLTVHEGRLFEVYGNSDDPRQNPDNNGVVIFPPESNITVVYILDYNLNQENYFYSVKACHPDKGCVETDPPLINRGRH